MCFASTVDSNDVERDTIDVSAFKYSKFPFRIGKKPEPGYPIRIDLFWNNNERWFVRLYLQLYLYSSHSFSLGSQFPLHLSWSHRWIWYSLHRIRNHFHFLHWHQQRKYGAMHNYVGSSIFAQSITTPLWYLKMDLYVSAVVFGASNAWIQTHTIYSYSSNRSLFTRVTHDIEGEMKW